ncbi:MAG: response regulator [Acidobacteriota bacterium]|nr:response regulator [Acidobacteriota bacterium]
MDNEIANDCLTPWIKPAMMPAKPLRILLVEDNRGDVLLVQQALAEHAIKHELHVVSDGEQAIRFIQSMDQQGGASCPDLLLLDLNLPRVEGQQVLSEFRKHPKGAQTPVIVVSSSDAPRDKARSGELGISRYFRKPSELDAFMALGAVVRQVVEATPRASATIATETS